MRALLLALALLVPALAAASDTELSGVEGHRRGHLPLSVTLPSFGDAALDAAARQAVDDWNRLTLATLGAAVFTVVPAGPAQVAVESAPRDPRGPMGITYIESRGGEIVPPVRIVIHEPAAMGQTSRETVFYQVFAHELGHALGLPHTKTPGSLMCCVDGSVDFKDPAARAAYVDARRHPDVSSVRAQLTDHYERFWRARP